jgi:hypothetical protein
MSVGGNKKALSQSWLLEAKSKNRVSEIQGLASLNFPVFGDLRQSRLSSRRKAEPSIFEAESFPRCTETRLLPILSSEQNFFVSNYPGAAGTLSTYPFPEGTSPAMASDRSSHDVYRLWTCSGVELRASGVPSEP